MTKENIMSLLYDYCRWESIEQIKELFKDYPNEIDLTEDDGMLFKMAVAYRSSELVSTLLDFYKETKLKENKDNKEYRLAEIQLRHMLQDAAEAHDMTDDIHKILQPYLIEYEDSDNEQDLSGYEDIIESPDGSPPCSLLKSHSASDFLVKKVAHGLQHSSSESLLRALDPSGSDGPHETDNLGKESELFVDL